MISFRTSRCAFLRYAAVFFVRPAATVIILASVVSASFVPVAAGAQTVPIAPPPRPTPDASPTPELPPTPTPIPTPVIIPTQAPTVPPTLPPSPTPPPTLPPTQPPTPTPQPTPLPAVPLLGITIGPQASAQAADGSGLTVISGSAVAVTSAPGGAQSLRLPIALNPGQRIASFTDPQSGLQATFAASGDSGAVVVPLTIEGVRARMRIEVGAITTQGTQVSVPVRRITLEAGPVAVASSSAPEAAFELSATLRQIPESVGLQIRSITLSEQLRSISQSAADRAGLAIESLAYPIEVRTTVSPLVAGGTLFLTVQSDWFAQWPENSLRLLRVDDQGRASLLGVALTDAGAPDKVRLQVESPEGFSTFAVVVVKPKVVVKGKGGGSGMGMILGVVAVGGVAVLAAGLYFMRRSKGKAKA